MSEKIVLITGATSGIGYATARLLGSHADYKLILTGRRSDRLKHLCDEINEQSGDKAIYLSFDIRSLDECTNAWQSLNPAWQNVDILINNAGLAKGLSEIHEGNLEHWEIMIDTNIKGMLYMTKLVSPQMVRRKSGQIINICSVAGKEAYPKGNVYSATKFAVEGLTRSMRIDLHQYNIRVSSISPGMVEETEFASVRFDGDLESAKIYNDFTPLNARDIADTIEFIITRPAHVNISDVFIMPTQQATATIADRSGRK